MTPAASRLKRRRNPAQGQIWCLLSRLLHVRNEHKSKPMNDLVRYKWIFKQDLALEIDSII
jgi:hypothetical protein